MTTFKTTTASPYTDLGLFAGRCLLAMVYLYSGLTKLIIPGAADAEFAHFGLPAILIFPTIALQIGGALALILGPFSRPAALALAAFTFAATMIAHAFWTFPEPERARQTVVFLEHLAIIGGLISLSATGPGRIALSLPAFRNHRS